MSFVGFWIPISAYPARVALVIAFIFISQSYSLQISCNICLDYQVITALLALITQQYQSSQVNVSYVIALHVWMIICIAFVFFALIEYAIAITYHDSVTAKANQTRAQNRNQTVNQTVNQVSDTIAEMTFTYLVNLFNSQLKKTTIWILRRSGSKCMPSQDSKPIRTESMSYHALCFPRALSFALYYI